MAALGNGYANGNGNLLATVGKSAVPSLHRSAFPDDFAFGAASAAYQYEGAARDGGRGPSIWDDFAQRWPGRIADASNGNVAIDFYNNFKDDVKIMKRMGLEAFRFSISWSRILPCGHLNQGINKEGIRFYNDLIDELLANGITPYVTLFHWDVPQALEAAYGGFLSSQIVADFADYVDLCFWEFGDRVKHWITLNEPWSFCSAGYVTGTDAPGRGTTAATIKSPTDDSTWSFLMSHRSYSSTPTEAIDNGNPGTEPYIVAHNLLLSHAAAVEIYRKNYQDCQKGKIGITNVVNWMVPYTDSKTDIEATERALDFMFGWFVDPVVNGHYPHSMRKYVGSRLPEFSEIESEKLRGSYDFLGVNYYTAKYVSDASNTNVETLSYTTDPKVKYTCVRNGVPIGPQATCEWIYVYPQGIYDLLVYVKRKYKNPSIYITENGLGDADDTKQRFTEARVDEMRKNYHIDHLRYLSEAIEDGVKVKGYFVWSLFDNYEWAAGYTNRFGLIFIEFRDGNLTRYPKGSGIWYMNFLNDKDTKAPKKLVAPTK
jgi:beta-glucosidase